MKSGKSAIEFRVQVIVEPDGNGFHAFCPALKGLHTCGQNEKEALKNAKIAASAYLQSLVEHGDPIPVGVESMKGIEAEGSASNVSCYVEDLRVAVACSI